MRMMGGGSSQAILSLLLLVPGGCVRLIKVTLKTGASGGDPAPQL